MTVVRTAAALLAALPLTAAWAPSAAAAQDGSVGSFGLGYASFSRPAAGGGTRHDGGLALEARVEDRVAPRVGLGLSFGWGLTDWKRARGYWEAGDEAASWTTGKLAQVERWATKRDADPKRDTRPLRFIGLVFADLFLVATYAAVPACYVGSLGGATSFLQADGTVSFHLAERGGADGWLEVGFGAAALPDRVIEWRGAVGPLAGVGVGVGRFRISARGLWSPPAMNGAPHGGPVTTGTVTLGFTE